MKTVIPDSKWRLSAQDAAELKRLGDMPDAEIRTDLVPELPSEAWTRAIKNPYAAKLHEQTQKKAS